MSVDGTGRRDLGKGSGFSGRDSTGGYGGRRSGFGAAGELRRPIPARYRVRPGDAVSLMDCRNPKCRRPFDPRFEVPRDRLCTACREEQAARTPMLPGMEDLK